MRKWKRLLLKLSGEALGGDSEDKVIDHDVLKRTSAEIIELHNAGFQVAIVPGGGNIGRGDGVFATEFDRAQGHFAGMLATVINGIHLEDQLKVQGTDARLITAFAMPRMAESYIHKKVIHHMEQGRIVILAGGTGDPFHTTDEASAQRSAELQVDVLLKGTSVDGVYDADPKLVEDAQRFEEISYDEFLGRGLRALDRTAITKCQGLGVPILVFDIRKSGNMLRAARHEIGTLIH